MPDTVWIPHPVDEDLSAAASWGVVKQVNRGYVYGDQYLSHGTHLTLPVEHNRNIVNWAEQFDPDHDHLLIVGDHAQLLVMTAALIGEHGWFHALRFDRKAGGYLSVVIS